ncbi:MAG: hypothetical protein U5L06_12605 [Rhodovibrio sp.]|nr:hypothetical protein [Rhodovibrio sp.]
MGFGVAVKREQRQVRLRAALFHVGVDPVVRVLRLGLRLFGLVQVAAGEHRTHLLRAVAALGGMRLVDDHGEVLAREIADLVDDHRELLQRGRDDRPALFQRVAQFLRVLLHRRHHAVDVLELLDGLAQLLVEDAPVGDHDDAVEHAGILLVERHGQLVREPGDGVRLAAARTVLDQVGLARPAAGHVGASMACTASRW